MDCTLPVTGSNLALVPLALIALAVGTLLAIVARRWGMRGGLTAVLVLAVGLVGLGARDADAQTTCPSETTAPTVSPTEVTPTEAPTTTIAPTTTVASTTSTTASTTTVATGVVGTPGGQTTTVPDLTIDLTGPESLTIGTPGSVTMTITNVGTAPTSGTMTFTLSELPTGITAYPTGMTTTEWSSVQTPTGWTFTSNSGLVIAPGITSTITFDVSVSNPGGSTSLTLTGVLPPGIGHETNAANNQDSATISLPAPA